MQLLENQIVQTILEWYLFCHPCSVALTYEYRYQTYDTYELLVGVPKLDRNVIGGSRKESKKRIRRFHILCEICRRNQFSNLMSNLTCRLIALEDSTRNRRKHSTCPHLALNFFCLRNKSIERPRNKKPSRASIISKHTFSYLPIPKGRFVPRKHHEPTTGIQQSV